MELRRHLENETVAEVGYRPPVSVTPDATIARTIETMAAEKVGCVLVIDGVRLCGIFTERDVLQRVLHADLPMDGPVSAVMTPDPVIAKEHEAAYLLLRRMYAGRHRHVPVVNDTGEAIGTVSVKRVARFIADHFASAIYNLPPEPNRYGTTSEGA